MRRKKPVTLNLPDRVRVIATEYAEANGRSLSSLIEHLLRQHLEQSGVVVDVSPREFAKIMAEKFGSAAKPKTKTAKKGGDVEL